MYLTEVVKALSGAGHEQAVIAGIAAEDAPEFPQGVLFQPVIFETDALPFPVAGMSDEMPYRATRYRDMTPLMVEQFRAAFTAAADELVSQFQPDLVICHHLYLLTAHFAQRDWGCPVYGLSHSTDIRQMRKIPLEREAIRAGIQQLDCILALHEAQADDICDVYDVPRSKVRVIGTGYNDAIFNSAAAGDAVRTNAHELVYAGKIWEKKGVPCLLRAIDLMPAEFDDLHLNLAGGYSNRAEYDAIVEQSKGCKRAVTFLGKLPQPELAKAYASAQVFVLPSFFEGLPLVVIEALACGCKVVVTDLPGIKQWLDAAVPEAPVFYVQPPRMSNTDEADPTDLPRFEQELAERLAEAFNSEQETCSVTHLSWSSVAQAMIGE